MRRAWWIPAGLVMAATRLDAQTPPVTDTAAAPTGVLVVGDHVDLRSHPVDRRGARAECEGDVTAIAGDTVVVGSANAPRICPRWTYAPDVVARLRVARGYRGSRVKHALAGFGIGAAAGSIVGLAIVAGDDCTGECDLDGVLKVAATLALGTLGGLAGTIVGVSMPAGPRWLPVPVPGPIRVAGMRVQPSLRVGTARRGR